jgi:predicted Zn-dependent protease
VLAALLLAGTGCVAPPADRATEMRRPISADERRAGAEAARQVEAEIGLVRDPELEAYVQRIGARLAAQAPQQGVTYRFAIADMPETNAFALPGGWIYVSRGLLALANSEAQLANVIGHEIGHVAAHHHSRQQSRATSVGVLSALGTIAAAVLGGPEAAQVVGSLGQLAGAGLIASYSRDQEREADEIGQELAARAGYDPAAMAGFLDALGREAQVGQRGPARRPSFLDSHPATPERVGTTRARARTLQVRASPPFAPTREAFLDEIKGIAIGPDPAQGLFSDTRFLHADLDLHVRFPSEWRTQNSAARVAAASPRGDALIQLEGQGQGDDPREAAEKFLERESLRVVSHRPLRVEGLRAYELIGTTSEAAAHITWIAYRGSVYRITGMSSPGSFRSYQALFERTARSFRPLTSAERGLFKKRVLEIAVAQPRETLESLGRRTRNGWGIEQTAVANGLRPGEPLAAGTLVKVAVEYPYQPARSRLE